MSEPSVCDAQALIRVGALYVGCAEPYVWDTRSLICVTRSRRCAGALYVWHSEPYMLDARTLICVPRSLACAGALYVWRSETCICDTRSLICVTFRALYLEHADPYMFDTRSLIRGSLVCGSLICGRETGVAGPVQRARSCPRHCSSPRSNRLPPNACE